MLFSGVRVSQLRRHKWCIEHLKHTLRPKNSHWAPCVVCMFSLFVVSRWMLITLDVCVCVSVFCPRLTCTALAYRRRTTYDAVCKGVCFDQCHRNRLANRPPATLAKKRSNEKDKYFYDFSIGWRKPHTISFVCFSITVFFVTYLVWRLFCLWSLQFGQNLFSIK